MAGVRSRGSAAWRPVPYRRRADAFHKVRAAVVDAVHPRPRSSSPHQTTRKHTPGLETGLTKCVHALVAGKLFRRWSNRHLMQSGIDNTLEIARLDSEEHSIKGGGEIVEGAVKNCHFFCFPKP